MWCWSKLLHPAPYATPQPVWRGDREHPLGNLTGTFENINFFQTTGISNAKSALYIPLHAIKPSKP